MSDLTAASFAPLSDQQPSQVIARPSLSYWQEKRTLDSWDREEEELGWGAPPEAQRHRSICSWFPKLELDPDLHM